MADIKTREINRGSIKTLDRATSTTHRMKNVAIRAKSETANERKNEENSSSFATDRTMSAGERSVYTAAGATELTVRRAYREYGEKKLKGEMQRQEIAGRIRDLETSVGTDRIRNNRIRLRSINNTNAQSAVANRQKSPKTASLIYYCVQTLPMIQSSS